MCHYTAARLAKGALISKNTPKTFGGRALPGPAREAYSAPPDSLAGIKGYVKKAVLSS